MTLALAILLIVLVAAFVISPLLRDAGSAAAPAGATGTELWKREKAVAVLAITEADFDRATGKLSDDDYRVLRSDYEGRALQAMDEIEKLAVAPAEGGTNHYCAGCGAPFSPADAFCGSCGGVRGAS